VRRFRLRRIGEEIVAGELQIVQRPHRVEEEWIAAPPGEEAVLSGRGYRSPGTTDAIVQSSEGSSIAQLSNLPASQ